MQKRRRSERDDTNERRESSRYNRRTALATYYNEYRTEAFVQSLKDCGGGSPECRRALLEAGLRHMVTPHITLSDNDVHRVIRTLEKAHSNHKHISRECFLLVLQEAVPLADSAEFDAARCQCASLEAAIEMAVAHVRGMPDARRLECVAQGCCVWAVDWSAAAADALFEALRVTTLGTVRDAFEHYTRTKSVVSLKGLLAWNSKTRLMVSAAGESEFEVVSRTAAAVIGDDASRLWNPPESKPRFIMPIHGQIVTPTYECTSGQFSRDLASVLVLVGGGVGAGKTLAALQFTMDSFKCDDYDELNIPVTCVYYCKAEDFTTIALDTADGTAPPPVRYFHFRDRRDLHSSTRRLAEYVIATLLGGSPSRKVVRSYMCRVAIVVDDVGLYPSLVSGLISDYYALVQHLGEALEVTSIQLVVAGYVAEFDCCEETDDRTKVLTLQITTNVWEMHKSDGKSLADATEEEFKYMRLMRGISEEEDTYDFGWLRSALTNARFASIFSNTVKTYVGGIPADTYHISDFLAKIGLRCMTTMAVQRCLNIAMVVKAPCEFMAIRAAIGAMIDRRPYDGTSAHRSLLKETHCLVTNASTIACGSHLCKPEDILRTRVEPWGAGNPSWVEGAKTGDMQFLYCVSLLKGRPFYMVDRVFSSLFMILVGRVFDTPLLRCTLTRAVMDFAFLAASLPPAMLEGRPGVPPLRRLLNGLGNDVSATAAACALRAVAPFPINEYTDWALTGAVAAVSAVNDDGDAATMRADAAFWEELRNCVRAGRAAVVSQCFASEEATLDTNRTGYATSLFVVAPRVVTLLHTVACPHDSLTAEQVREALLRMAPAGAWDDCVAGPATESTRNSFVDPSEVEVLRQRVPEELVALVRGVRFRRCPQTQRAVVRRPPAGDTAPPACVVNVAVVFEGAYAAGLRDHVLCGAYGAQWSDLAASGSRCSGPFAVREASPYGGAPDGGRSRAEVVLDYALEQSAELVTQRQRGRPKDAKHRRRAAPTTPCRDDVLRVAYRYYLVDVTWRRRASHRAGQRRGPPVRSDACWLSPYEDLPPLYPVPQTESVGQVLSD